MIQRAAECPLLVESDALSLSTDFGVKELMLCDTHLKASHQLIAPADQLVLALQNGVTYGQLQHLAKQQQVLASQLFEFLAFLNIIGALQVARTWRSRIHVAFTRVVHLGFGAAYPSLTWRKEATTLSLLQASLRACTPLIIAVIPCTVLIIGAHMLSFEQACQVSLLGIAVFIASIYIHELAHVMMIKRAGVIPVVVQSGLRLGIVHQKLNARSELMTALAGPLAGISGCMLVSLTVTAWPLLTWTAGGLALIQLGSFLPMYGDGATIYQQLKRSS